MLPNLSIKSERIWSVRSIFVQSVALFNSGIENNPFFIKLLLLLHLLLLIQVLYIIYISKINICNQCIFIPANLIHQEVHHLVSTKRHSNQNIVSEKKTLVIMHWLYLKETSVIIQFCYLMMNKDIWPCKNIFCC